MSRRKPLAVRMPCGRPRPESRDTHLMSPVQIRRLIDAAASESRDPLWASRAGQLHLNGKISSSEFAAAKRWIEVIANYSAALRSPKPPKTVLLDAIGGSPDGETNEREVRRHERASAEWLAGRDALRSAGGLAERTVSSVCELDQAPAGYAELVALRAGLAALAALWSAKRKASAR